jgi:hypothetical protein
VTIRPREAALACLLLAIARWSGGQDRTHSHDSEEGWLGAYPLVRESSGTSWQPEAAGMEGRHGTVGPWRVMAHAFAFGIYTQQGGPRGGRQWFSTNMALLAAGRPLWGGKAGVRAMASLEPLMGRAGYTELLQTGESADGISHLIDRQHPHDLPMELATTYSRAVGRHRSAFLYLGWPGDPALGPSAFMHRPSAQAIAIAPLTHHWMDSTHITFGVVTAGFVIGPAKIDASAFNGREPDSRRWGFDAPRLDSASVRLTLNPSALFSIQVSAGELHAPERLHPTIDVRRYTASASWSGTAFGLGVDSTLAWGRNLRNRPLPNCFVSAGCWSASIPFPPSQVQDGFLIEATVRLGGRHLVFTRAERVQKDELFPGLDPFHARVFPIGSVQLGYLYDLWSRGPIAFRAGGAAGIAHVPEFIQPDYGRRPFSYWILAQARLR